MPGKEVQWEMLIGSNKTKRFLAPDAVAATKIAKKAGATSVIRLSQNFKPIGKPISLRESAELAKKLVRGEKSGPGLLNKLSQWFGRMMITKDANRFVPAQIAIDQLKRSGFSPEQITLIRDAATSAANTAVETMHKKHGEEAVPRKYISKLPSSFGVFDLYLNVSNDIHEEFAALMRKLFDMKINKLKDKLNIVKEASTLNENGIDDTKDSKTADQLEVGDTVEITGDVEYQGSMGEIVEFNSNKTFVVVKLYSGGTHSFHTSDVSAEEDEDEDKEEDTFFVVFNDSSNNTWIGEVTKSGGGKWREHPYKGKPDYRWGTTYMSYLSPDDVMSWIHKDYSRGMEIEGPFTDAQEAEDYAEHHFGKIEESFGRKFANRVLSELLAPKPEVSNKQIDEAAYTDFDDWKQAVLNSYPAQAKKIKFKGRMEGKKTTISAEIPGEDRSYGVWDQDEEKGTVLSEKIVQEGVSPFQLKTKVRFVKGPKDVVGKEGYIAEIRKEVTGKRTFTVDYQDDNGRTASIYAPAEHLRVVKEKK